MLTGLSGLSGLSGVAGGSVLPPAIAYASRYVRGGYTSGNWTDITGNGKHLTQSTAGFRAGVDTEVWGLGCPVFDGVDDDLANASLAVDKRDFSMSICFYPDQIGNNSTVFAFGNALGIFCVNGLVKFFRDSGVAETGMYLVYGKNTLILNCTASGVTLRLNGVDYTQGALTAGTLTGLNMAFLLGGTLQGKTVPAEVLVGPAMSSDQMTAMGAYLDTITYTRPARWYNPLVVWTGNSFMQAGGASSAANGFVALCQAEITGPAQYINVSVSGQSTDSLVANDPARYIDRYLSTDRAINVVVIFETINYLGNAVHTGADCWNLTSQLCDLIHAKGATTLFIAPTPKSYPGTPAGYESERQAFLTLMRADTTKIDHTYDVAAEVGMGFAGDELTNPNYLDQIHPSDPGHRKFANGTKIGLDAFGINV